MEQEPLGVGAATELPPIPQPSLIQKLGQFVTRLIGMIK